MIDGIPEWVFWISTAVGTALSAFIVRMGWKNGTAKTAETVSEGYIDKLGVLVDAKSIELLAGSLEGLTMEAVVSRKNSTLTSEAATRIGSRLVEEIAELRGDVRDLSRAIRQRE